MCCLPFQCKRLRRWPDRRGYTLLELMAATALTAAALVPALKLIGRSLELGRELETRNLLTTLCVSTLEQHLALAAADGSTADEAGTFAAEGFANVRYHVVRSEAVADGGIPEKLLAVRATVWQDADGDGAAGADEMQITLRSKIAHMMLYQDVAAGS